MSEPKGIQQTLELLEAVKLLAVVGAKMGKDKKLGMDDLAQLVELGKNFGVLAAAAKDVGEVAQEIKDIDQAEAALLLAKTFELVKAMKEALAV